MSLSKRFVVAAVCLALSATAALYRADTARDLVETANTFMESLDSEQLAKVKFDFTDEERFNFHFIPRDRFGLPLKEMQPHQQALAHAMMAAALGQRGFIKTTTIISLEQILAEIEGPDRRFPRDPGLYYISIFGDPSATSAWAWRLEGHHIAFNVTIQDGKVVGSAPAFLGSNPAEVRDGPRRGLRALGREEDLARDLLASLNADQKREAIINTTAPNDIVTGNSRKAEIGDPVGIQASRLDERQRTMLISVIEEYTGRMSADVAMTTMNEIRQTGIENVHFAWAGTEARGQAHYYRIHGPTFLIEYDNSQNNANHIHSVFRDLNNDFGIDPLRAHYEAFHGLAAAD